MAINWKPPPSWRERRLPSTDYNDISFSIAWQLKTGEWKTYYRLFHLTLGLKTINGQYTSNLHFDERILPEEKLFNIMIYGVSKDTTYEEIEKKFNNNDFDFLLFKEIFRLTHEELRFYLPNLKVAKKCFVRLKGCEKKNNQLQISLYTGNTPSSKQDGEIKNVAITLPHFQIPISNIE